MDRLYGINLIAVLIDSYENQEFSGRLMHPWSAEAIPFASCMELMAKMEALYDAWDYPEAAQSTRVFIRHRSEETPREFVSERRLTELSKEQTPREIWGERGRLASFFVRTEPARELAGGRCLDRGGPQLRFFEHAGAVPRDRSERESGGETWRSCFMT